MHIIHRKKIQQSLWGYFFIGPVFIGLLIFYIYPFIQNFLNSFYDINNFNRAKFTGIKNYTTIIADPEFWSTAYNTFIYVIISVPIGMAVSTFLAALLNSSIRGKSLYRTLYFLPAVTMPAAIAMVWKWIFNGQYGLLNQILAVAGMSPRNWLSEPSTALYMIIIVAIWSSAGYNMVILLAGMQGISRSYYEAARIDGAGVFTQFFHITLPLLTPSLFFVMLTSMISGFQVFDTIYMMVGKASIAYESTQSLVMMFYRYAFDYGKKGYASALSVFIFLIIMCITIVQLKLQKKWVNYD
ncbi:sugar ABC transporter permease [Treponema phagedenis]|nr:sugar ABC transporter permease [Treponema phagedenis]